MSASPAVTAAAPAPLILKARKVTKRFGGLVAVRDVDFDIPQGAIVSLIGPNGAGKTTFFNVIAGLIDPSGGTIDFANVRLVARPTRAWAEPFFWIALPVVAGLVGGGLFVSGDKIAGELVGVLAVGLLAASLLVAIIRPAWYVRLLTLAGIFRSARPNEVVDRGISRTFQNIRLFGHMTAVENVQVGMHSRLRATPLDAVLRSRRHAKEEVTSRERAAHWLEYVGLRGREEEQARNLPYGDQRRLEIARALASEPKLLLLDEPTAGMNPVETGQMTALFGRIRKELDVTILLIEHDMRVVMGVSDRVTVLDHGEKIAEGTPDVVRQDPLVIEAYLGKGASA